MDSLRATTLTEEEECDAHADGDDQQDQESDKEADDCLAELRFFIVIAREEVVETGRHDGRCWVGLC